MKWWNPATWGQPEEKAAEYTLDALLARLAEINKTASGVVVNPDTALKAPTMYAIANVMSRTVAGLPFRLEQNVGTEDKPEITVLDAHPVHRLFSIRPTAWQTAFEYWQLVILRLILYGEHYAQILRNRDGRVIRLEPLKPPAVEVQRANNGRLVYAVSDDRGNTRTLRQDQVHRIVFMSEDGIRGTSPVSKCSNSIALEIAAEEFGSQVFGSGAIPTGIIQRQGHFKSEEDHKSFAKRWRQAFGKKRGTAVLEEGWEFKPIQLNNEESQFLETRKHQRTVIAGTYGIPPHKVGDLERATFSNIEEQSLDFVTNAVRPYLECSEQAVSRDFLTDEERVSKVNPQFRTVQMLRGDIKTRSEAFRIWREMGIISANEWRALEGMNPREDEDGDEYITPLNFRQTGDEDDDGDEQQGDTQVVAMRRIR